MQVSLMVCYLAVLSSETIAMLMTLLILWAGFLLFGLDPTPEDEEHS
ncbi:MAG: hypothetical protein WA888_06280 [Burkholderiaceae bacterium]|jgi:hypothetical protein